MPDPFENESGITVGKLIKELKLFSSDDPICFGQHGHFTFYRTNDRNGCVQIEFNEREGFGYELMPDHPYVLHLKKQGTSTD